MLKRSGIITYNIADRGRKHNGVDRSDMDIQSAIARINSDDVQELVNSGDLFGYYGHETRARFGMTPPDSWVAPDGKTIRIEPAIRTISLSADNDGNISHEEEFLDTDHGKYSANLYKNKAGGFSSAIMRSGTPNQKGLRDIKGFYGFDYVRTPNYDTNRGTAMFDALFLEDEDGELVFDSLATITPQQVILKQALEAAIIHQYDNINGAIHAQQMIEHYQAEAQASQQDFISRQQHLENLRERRVIRTEEVLDGLICPSTKFDEMQAQWDSFAYSSDSDLDLTTVTTKADEREQRKRRDRRDERNIFGRR